MTEKTPEEKNDFANRILDAVFEHHVNNVKTRYYLYKSECMQKAMMAVRAYLWSKNMDEAVAIEGVCSIKYDIGFDYSSTGHAMITCVTDLEYEYKDKETGETYESQGTYYVDLDDFEPEFLDNISADDEKLLNRIGEYGIELNEEEAELPLYQRSFHKDASAAAAFRECFPDASAVIEQLLLQENTPEGKTQRKVSKL